MFRVPGLPPLGAKTVSHLDVATPSELLLSSRRAGERAEGKVFLFIIATKEKARGGKEWSPFVSVENIKPL